MPRYSWPLGPVTCSARNPGTRQPTCLPGICTPDRKVALSATERSSRSGRSQIGAHFRIRPNPLAPIRVADYWIAAVDAKRCLLLLIRSGRAARLCKRVRAAAPTGQPEPGSPLVHSPTRRSPLGWRSRFRFHLGGFPDRTFPINGEEKPGSFVAGRLLSVDDLTHAFNGKHPPELATTDFPCRPNPLAPIRVCVR